MEKKIKYSTNFWLNKYISNCDLIYKYNLKNKEELPLIEQIKLSLNLKDLILNTKNKNLNSQDYRSAYFFLFSLFLINPYIHSKPTNNNFNTIKQESDNIYIISIFLKNSKYLDEFFFLLFIEIWSKNLKSKFKLSLQKKTIEKNKNYIVSKIPLFILPSFEYFYDISNIQSNYEELFLFILFTFQNIKFKSKKKSIKNLPLFWKII
jgi:hypothetical protein